MPEEFIIRGQTADFKTTGDTHTINFSGHKRGYGFKLIEFQIYPSTGLHEVDQELSGAITAGTVPADPVTPDFTLDGLIGNVLLNATTAPRYPIGPMVSVINDTFIITQDLILTVVDLGGAANAVNWQLRFKPVKMGKAEEAAVNYKQFTIYD